MESPKYLRCILIIRIWNAPNKKKHRNNHRNNGMSKWKIKLVWIFLFDTIDGIKYIAELQNSFIFFFPEFFCFSIYACKYRTQCTQSELFEMMSVYLLHTMAPQVPYYFLAGYFSFDCVLRSKINKRTHMDAHIPSNVFILTSSASIIQIHEVDTQHVILFLLMSFCYIS